MKSVEPWVRFDLNFEKGEGEDGKNEGQDQAVVPAAAPQASASTSGQLVPTADWKKFVKGKLSDK